MEQFELLNSIPGGDAQKLLSDTIVKAASSAALAAVRSVLADKPKKKKTGGTLKFSNRELNSMSDKLKNYFVCKDRLVSYRFHKRASTKSNSAGTALNSTSPPKTSIH